MPRFKAEVGTSFHLPRIIGLNSGERKDLKGTNFLSISLQVSSGKFPTQLVFFLWDNILGT